MKINLTIPGAPISWRSHAGYGKKSFNPLFKEREYFHYYIKQQYHESPIQDPVAILYTFYLPIPVSFSKKKRESALNHTLLPTVRKDLTNFIKFSEDTLKELVIQDDSQVVMMISWKYYSDNPRTDIEIFTDMWDTPIKHYLKLDSL